MCFTTTTYGTEYRYKLLTVHTGTVTCTICTRFLRYFCHTCWCLLSVETRELQHALVGACGLVVPSRGPVRRSSAHFQPVERWFGHRAIGGSGRGLLVRLHRLRREPLSWSLLSGSRYQQRWWTVGLGNAHRLAVTGKYSCTAVPRSVLLSAEVVVEPVRPLRCTCVTQRLTYGEGARATPNP